MKRGKRCWVVGIVDPALATKWYIHEHASKKIVNPLYLREHIERHKEEYRTQESFSCTMRNIRSIILSPDYVFYDKRKKGLEYYKCVLEPVCVVVKLGDKRELKVASVYPVAKEKIVNRKNREKSQLKILKEKQAVVTECDT